MKFSHTSVLQKECLDALAICEDGVYVDGTTGGAGHAIQIAERLRSGMLYAFDQDPDAVAVAKGRLEGYPAQVIHSNFDQMQEKLLAYDVKSVDGVLLDLGVSSFQLDNPERGFSYRHKGALDMRMRKEGMSAADFLNHADEDKIETILREYGEEKYSRFIAKGIVKARPLNTTQDLADVILRAVPAKARKGKNPCRRTFQAVRIAVNGELDSLQNGLKTAFSMLNTGGRLVVLTFHSLEDRIVKQYFASLCQGCTCPPGFPVCICGNQPKAKWVHKKPIIASPEEQEVNRRSRSAKLRILEKV